MNIVVDEALSEGDTLELRRADRYWEHKKASDAQMHKEAKAQARRDSLVNPRRR